MNETPQPEKVDQSDSSFLQAVQEKGQPVDRPKVAKADQSATATGVGTAGHSDVHEDRGDSHHFVVVTVSGDKVIVESTGPAAMTAEETQDLIDELAEAKFQLVAEASIYLTFRSNDWEKKTVRGVERCYYPKVCTEDGQVRTLMVGLKVHAQLQNLLANFPCTVKMTYKQGVYLVDKA